MKKCPMCLEMIPEDASFCGYCKTDLLHPMPKSRPPEGITLNGIVTRVVQAAGLLLGILFLIGFVVGLTRGGSRTQRDTARRKACYANMRVLMGAIEMYNMDHPTPLRTLDVQRLQRENYLKSIPICPLPENRYSFKPLDQYNYEIRCAGKDGHGMVD